MKQTILPPPTTQLQEVWKDVKGYEGLYQVSDKGRVKRMKRKQWSELNNCFCHHKERILKPYVDKKGYSKYSLHKKGDGGKTQSTHKIVGEAFIPNPENKPTLNHINEIKDDNRVENLEWMTIKENVNHGTGIERRALKHSIYVGKFSLRGELLYIYQNQRKAQELHGFNYHCISMCIRGKLNTHKELIWKEVTGREEYLKHPTKPLLPKNLMPKLPKIWIEKLKLLHND